MSMRRRRYVALVCVTSFLVGLATVAGCSYFVYDRIKSGAELTIQNDTKLYVDVRPVPEGQTLCYGDRVPPHSTRTISGCLWWHSPGAIEIIFRPGPRRYRNEV